MKILHLCLQTSYTIGWGYQDNIIPKYHAELGHDVTIITTTAVHEQSIKTETSPDDILLEDGQRLIRLKYENIGFSKLSNIVRKYKIYDLLTSISPDFIMVHGLSNISVLQVRKYVKKVNPDCVVVADNHMDYYNGITPVSLKKKLWIFAYRLLNKIMQKTYSKVYGVTPWRVQYQQEILGIKPEKSGLWIMGGDDDKILFDKQEQIKKELRAKHNINDDDFLIITGGKIDKTKNIHLVAEAVRNINRDNVKLLVFGQPSRDFEKEFNQYINSEHIRFIGWLSGETVYDYFLASDLAVFPGTHSVLWEQACACALPGVFKSWDGMHHVDAGGNAVFLKDDSAKEIEEKIIEIIDNDKYKAMKNIALNVSKEFSYKEISKKVISEE